MGDNEEFESEGKYYYGIPYYETTDYKEAAETFMKKLTATEKTMIDPRGVGKSVLKNNDEFKKSIRDLAQRELENSMMEEAHRRIAGAFPDMSKMEQKEGSEKTSRIRWEESYWEITPGHKLPTEDDFKQLEPHSVSGTIHIKDKPEHELFRAITEGKQTFRLFIDKDGKLQVEGDIDKGAQEFVKLLKAHWQSAMQGRDGL